MKSINKIKKGFTIVELVIVIAVIAALAAVLIPTFVNVVNSANESSDIQATKNMNTALYSEEILNGKPGNLAEVHEILSEAGYSDTLLPVTSNYHWYWNSYYNIIMLIDDSDGWELIYPQTDDAGNAYTQYVSCCYNINTAVTLSQTALVTELAKENAVITVKTYKSYDSSGSSGDVKDNAGWEDIVALANDLGENFAGATIKLDADIVITSTNPVLNFQGTFDGNSKTITVSAGGITPVYGDSGNGYLYYKLYEANKYKYSYGLFASVTNGGTVKNLTVSYSDAENSVTNPGNKYTYYGGIAGCLDDGTISGCTVKGNIYQYNRVGGIVGTALYGTVENCMVEANITSLYVSTSDAGYSYAGGIIGYAGNDKSYVKTITVSNCTVGPASGSISITAQELAGGVVAYITDGVSEFNIGGTTTVQNATVKINDNTKKTVGAICGRLIIVKGLTGGATIKNVSVVNRTNSEDVNMLYVNNYTTSSGTDKTVCLMKTKTSSVVSTSGTFNSDILIVVGYYSDSTIQDSEYTDNVYTYTGFSVTYTATN